MVVFVFCVAAIQGIRFWRAPFHLRFITAGVGPELFLNQMKPKHLTTTNNGSPAGERPPATPMAATPAAAEQTCLTRPALAAFLVLSIRTVDRMIAAGEIEVNRLHGRSVRIQRAEAERVLAATKAQTTAKQTFPQNKQ